jgi:hypothetical protein
MPRRNKCVFCNSIITEIVYTQKDFPITFGGNKNIVPYETIDIEWVSCKSCDIIQLVTLVEPIKLYGNTHNNTGESLLWINHHNMLYNFIKNSITTNKILEIGAENGVLAQKFIEENYKYSILNIFEEKNKIDGIEYIQHNCEDYDYVGIETIVLSHVFEHLYNPRRFVETISKSKVKNIVLSVPNLKMCLTKNTVSFINNEHTYYFEESHIIKLFELFNYKLNKKEYCKDYSIFFSFNYVELTNTVDLLKEYFIKRESDISSIILDKPTYIVPGGHYGSVIYYYLKNKEYVSGFLDNDKGKQGTYMYGTNLLIYSLNHIKDLTNISILLHAGPYTNEITNQLKDINSEIDIKIFY